jgi:ribonucleoside-diphosphate reductase alpha chain
MMDCDTTGVEPDLALVKYKKLVGGGTIKIVNQTVPLALKRLGYDAERSTRSSTTSTRRGTIEGAPGLQARAPARFRLRVPRVERHASIHYSGPRPHDVGRPALPLGRDLQDVNLPPDATPDEIAGVYMDGWKQGLKADRDLPRRLQAHAAPQHRGVESDAKNPRSGPRSSTSARRRAGPGAVPPQAPGRAPLDHAQVRRRRPRGLHHGRPLRGRQARRDLPAMSKEGSTVSA